MIARVGPEGTGDPTALRSSSFSHTAAKRRHIVTQVWGNVVFYMNLQFTLGYPGGYKVHPPKGDVLYKKHPPFGGDVFYSTNDGGGIL